MTGACLEIPADPHDDVRRRYADLHAVRLVEPMPDPRRAPFASRRAVIRPLARFGIMALEAVACIGFVACFWWALS